MRYIKIRNKTNRRDIMSLKCFLVFTAGPCLNDGVCINVRGIAGVITNFDCDCPPQWFGPLCQNGKKMFILIRKERGCNYCESILLFR